MWNSSPALVSIVVCFKRTFISVMMISVYKHTAWNRHKTYAVHDVTSFRGNQVPGRGKFLLFESYIRHKMAYRCNVCVSFIALTLSLFLNHLHRYHLSDPSFHVLCGINGCAKTYKKCISYRNHIIRKHSDVLKAERECANQTIMDDTDYGTDCCPSEDLIDNSTDIDGNDGETHMYDLTSLPQFDFQRETEEIRRTGALHLLRMKYQDRASQKAVDSFVESTTSIVRTSMEILKAGLMNRLDTAGIDFNAVPGLPGLFKEDILAMNPFSGIRKENEQHKYYKDNLGLLVGFTSEC